jgi:hypothetical protein
MAVALMLEGVRVSPLPRELPSIWCTAPTRDRFNLGIALNGPIAVDVGRSRMAATEDNRRIIRRLGELLGRALVRLDMAATQQPDEVSRALGLPFPWTAHRTEFWTSCWDSLATPLANEHGAEEVVADLHVRGRGLSALANAGTGLVPTGLPGDWGGLTVSTRVRFEVPEPAANLSVLQALAAFERFRTERPPGTLVAPKIARVLRRLGAAHIDRQSIRELAIVAMPSRAAPEDAAACLALVESLDGNVHPSEVKGLFDAIEFRSAAANPTWDTPGRLLLPLVADNEWEVLVAALPKRDVDWDEERMRAAFAPAARRLDPGYATGGSLAFFVRSRIRLEVADATDLASWAEEAATDATRSAVLRYLLRGQLSEALADKLRDDPLAWLPDPAAVEIAGPQLNDAEKAAVAAKLFPPTYRQILDLQGAVPSNQPLVVTLGTSPVARRDGRRLLESLAKWWDDSLVSVSHIRRWHEAHYPRPWPEARITEALKSAADPTHDEAWMLLLTLGACQQLGRVRPEQHRGFVSLLAQEGWWETLCAPGPPPSDWVSVVHAWAERGIQTRDYDWWRGVLPVIYQLRCWLDEYRRVLLAAQHLLGKRLSFEALWQQRVNAMLRGTDLDAPPLMALRKIGGHWAMRELARLGIVSGPAVTPHCYVPRLAVRKLMGGLNLTDGEPDTSAEIHAAIVDVLGSEMASFGGAYDIPLTLVALDSDLLRALLRDELRSAPSAADDDLFPDALDEEGA